MKLLSELYANGILSESQKNGLEEQIKKTGKKEEEIILEKRLVSEEFLFDLKSRINKIPLRKVEEKQVPPEVLSLVPREASQNYKMIAIGKKGKIVEIGMVYPEDIYSQNALRFLGRQERFDYEIYLITLSNFEALIKQQKDLKSETKKVLDEIEKEKEELVQVIEKKAAVDIKADEAPIIKMVFVILRHALESRASDIHIEPCRDRLNVRFRVDGVLYSKLNLPLNVHPSVVARIKILSNLKIDETRVPQDGRFATKINGSEIDFRVSTFPTLNGEKMALRLLNQAEGSKPLEKLGIRGKNLEIIKTAAKKPFGLVLATGPTGSGKTTTLYSLLHMLKSDSINIVTLEDPIEYSLEGANQSQIRPEIGYSFAQGLRQILRQDPNVIMVGEIRDEETSDLAINAALTGHIVLSTLHTNSAAGVVPRLIDMGIRPFLIPSTLKVVISQRLVRTLCPDCRKKIRPNEKIKKYILDKIKALPDFAKKEIPASETLYVYESAGCEACSNKGYSGRVGLYEVLSMDDQIASAILKDPSESSVSKIAQKQGMLTMEQEGIIKVLNGETSIEEVVRVTEST